MTRVFIGGSRRITRLNADVKQRLDRIIEMRLPVLVGDANGADRAVQDYLRSRGYDLVEVFCSGEVCRNNTGDWTVRSIPVAGKLGDDEFGNPQFGTKRTEVGEQLYRLKYRSEQTAVPLLVEAATEDEVLASYPTVTRDQLRAA